MSGGSPPNVMGEADAPQMKFGGLVTTDARDRKQKFEEGGQVTDAEKKAILGTKKDRLRHKAYTDKGGTLGAGSIKALLSNKKGKKK